MQELAARLERLSAKTEAVEQKRAGEMDAALKTYRRAIVKALAHCHRSNPRPYN